MDFTVIIAVRQRFGDDTPELSETPVEQEAPFVGQAKDFPFSCPNVAVRQLAVLQFQSLGVTALRDFGLAHVNILRINGVDIPGGITRGPAAGKIPLWTTHSVLIPENTLREQNTLHIESVPVPLAHESTLDNFIIDNVVVLFKTRVPGPFADPDVANPIEQV
jgi:hypothetical protein